MMRKLSIVATVVAAIALPAAAQATDSNSAYCQVSEPPPADTPEDMMYCDGRRMVEQSRCHMCVAQCASDDSTVGTCTATCQDVLDAAIDRINHSPRCDGIPDPDPLPDPETCTAQLMRADARNMFCHARCMHRRNPDDCATGCVSRLHAAQGRICAKDVCKNGPAAPLPQDLCTAITAVAP